MENVPMILSRGARLCESVIRTARARPGGHRVCGRPFLARRLGCSVRTVSRYIAELRAAGRLEVTPPRREKRRDGWRTVGVNAYRLLAGANPAPHVHGPARLRRSRRDDTTVTPPPTGAVAGGQQPPAHCLQQAQSDAAVQYAAAQADRHHGMASVRAALRGQRAA